MAYPVAILNGTLCSDWTCVVFALHSVTHTDNYIPADGAHRGRDSHGKHHCRRSYIHTLIDNSHYWGGIHSGGHSAGIH